MRTDLVAGLALLLAFAAPAAGLQAVGSAVSIADGELLYREFHRCDTDGIHCHVEYREPGGEMFARKQLDYSRAPWAPSFYFEDWRLDEQVRVDADSVAGEVVIDAGFDNYVRRNWSSLAAGDRLTFRFLAATLSRPISMRAEQQGSCADNLLCIVVQPQSWFLGLIGGEIRLVYSREEQRLLEFQGVSNIPDALGDSREVRIYYEYPSSAAGDEQGGSR